MERRVDAPTRAPELAGFRRHDAGPRHLWVAEDWEREVLMSFEARKAEGQDPKTLEHYAFVEQDGQQVFRYMKAIPTGEVCVACHGSELSPEVTAALAELYPQDQATGFQPGDIRGAFTITQPVAQ